MIYVKNDLNRIIMLQPATIKFLTQLKKNNDKPWFDAHKEKYLAAKEDFEELVKQIIIEYGKTDPEIGSLEYKRCVFRIYRDVRFSKDKTPYKTHFAARFAPRGREVHFPCYYLHIEPGQLSVCGGGIWRPEVEELKKVRQEIDYNFDEFKSIVHSKKFKSVFGDLEQEDKLSRAPQGYEEDNPALDYLKLKSFFSDALIDDNILTSKLLLKKITSAFATVRPLIGFLNRALE